jgi:uncharacterized protein (DUF885 family)
MRKLFLITPLALLVAAILATTLTACSPAPSYNQTADKAATASDQSESGKLKTFFADSFEQDLKRSPMMQSRLGIKWDYGKWDDVSVAFAEESRSLRASMLERAQLFNLSQLNAAEKLSLELYITDLQRKLANDKFPYHKYVMHQFRAWHTRVPSFLINIHKVTEKSDAEAYVSRLESVSPLFDQVIAQLSKREEVGVFPPSWSYDQMIQASANVLVGQPFDDSALNSAIWEDFLNKVAALNLSKVEVDDLQSRAQKAMLSSVAPAYKKLIGELEKQAELTPEGDGVWRLPKGKEWYQNRLNWFTTTTLNADEVHQLGVDNVTRIHNEMRDIMQTVNFADDLGDFFEFMRSDPQFYYAPNDEGRNRYMQEAKAYIDTMEAKIPEYFGLLPKARMTVKRVEAFREQSAGKAFYQSPSKDGARPGIYYANLYNMADMPRYQMEALAYHEGIPGHHMQRAIAQELDGIPEFQKYVSFTAYTEGWGLYTEELGKDMGFYEDPYSDFGRLAMELWRACRLVVDTGLHDKKWSREKAIAYLVENTPNSENDANKAIERYIAIPGQATAYLVGKLKIMELRTKAQQVLGDKFDYRGFHDEILKDGPVPMSILEQKINAWIERTASS